MCDVSLVIKPVSVPCSVGALEIISLVVTDVLLVLFSGDARNNVQVKVSCIVQDYTSGFPMPLLRIHLILDKALIEFVDVFPGIFYLCHTPCIARYQHHILGRHRQV